MDTQNVLLCASPFIITHFAIFFFQDFFHNVVADNCIYFYVQLMFIHLQMEHPFFSVLQTSSISQTFIYMTIFLKFLYFTLIII